MGKKTSPVQRGTDEPIDKADYERLAAFRYALRQFIAFSEQVATGVGLTPQQHQALLAVKGYPGRDSVTVGELAERLQIKHHSAVGLIDRLVSQGLMKRQAAEHDRRVVMVSLTSQGEELLRGLSAAHRDELRRIVPEMQKLLAELNGG